MFLHQENTARRGSYHQHGGISGPDQRYGSGRQRDGDWSRHLAHLSSIHWQTFPTHVGVCRGKLVYRSCSCHNRPTALKTH